MFGLTWPWLLAGGALAIPALVAIYKLRQRSRKRLDVSAMFLWEHVQQIQSSGQKVQQLRTSRLFWIELVVLCLLLLAASGPTLLLKRDRGPLVIVLDNSFSMLAGGRDSALSRARAFVDKTLRKGDYSFVRFVGAGAVPQVWGGLVDNPQQAKAGLRHWRGMAPFAALKPAIALAHKLGGVRGRVLVVTDQPPPRGTSVIGMRWHGFGVSRPNTAIVYASRVRLDQKDWCLLEVMHTGSPQITAILTLQIGEQTSSRQTRTLTLRDGERRRIRFALPSPTISLRAWLGDDALAIDNRVHLLPRAFRPLRVQVALGHAKRKALVEQTLRATKRVALVQKRADLLWTERPSLVAPSPQTWGVHWLQEKGEAAYTGPFVLNRTHPLTHGLSLRGVIWGAGGGKTLPGLPIVTAGNIPLVTARNRGDGGQAISLRWRPSLSTFAHTPGWPVLVWNILEWRARHLPGIREPNVSLGSVLQVAVEAGRQVRVVSPSGKASVVSALANGVRLPAREVGVHTVEVGPEKWSFSVHALQAEESTLTSLKTGSWGRMRQIDEKQRAPTHLGWLVLVLVLGLLTFHAYDVASQKEVS
jgi:hypothetical protein